MPKNSFAEIRVPRGPAPSAKPARAPGAPISVPVRRHPEINDSFIAFGMLSLRVADPVAVFLTLLVITRLNGVYIVGPYVALAVIAALLTVTFFAEAARAQPWYHDGYVGMAVYLLGSWMMVVGILFLLGTATGYIEKFQTASTYTWLLIAPVVIVAQHALVRAALMRYVRSSLHIRQTVIVGVNEASLQLSRHMKTQSQLGFALHGFFDDRSAERLGLSGDYLRLGRMSDIHDYVKREKINVIYIALPMTQHERVLTLLDSLRDTTASIYFIPDIFVFELIQGRIDDLNGIPVVAVCETPFHGLKGIAKRLTDVLFSIAALVLIAPLLALVAVAVKVSSPGPVLFKQRRYGLDGEQIVVYKFRTMTVCEDGEHVVQASRNDARITRIGSFLRRTSLDELPQFINVLQGRMSVVGPRPHAVAHNELYRKLIKGYMMRHKVKPGITGWAQVNGLRGATEDVDKMRRRIEHDLDYLRNWSLALDAKIVVGTVLTLIRNRNAF